MLKIAKLTFTFVRYSSIKKLPGKKDTVSELDSFDRLLGTKKVLSASAYRKRFANMDRELETLDAPVAKDDGSRMTKEAWKSLRDRKKAMNLKFKDKFANSLNRHQIETIRLAHEYDRITFGLVDLARHYRVPIGVIQKVLSNNVASLKVLKLRSQLKNANLMEDRKNEILIAKMQNKDNNGSWSLKDILSKTEHEISSRLRKLEIDGEKQYGNNHRFLNTCKDSQ